MTLGSCLSFTGVGNGVLSIPAEIFILKVPSRLGCRAEWYIAVSGCGFKINILILLPPPYIKIIEVLQASTPKAE